MSAKQVLERLDGMDEIRCGRCGKTKHLSSGTRRIVPSEIKLKVIHKATWHIDKRLAALDRCPECQDIHRQSVFDHPPAPPARNGHDEHHEEPPALHEIYMQVINLAAVDWRENENMFVATVVAMSSQLEQILENNFALLRQDHRAPIAAALRDLVETAQLADILTTAPTDSEPQPEADPHPVLKWLESLT